MVTNSITAVDVVELLKLYRIAVFKVFTDARLVFDFETNRIVVVSNIRTSHHVCGQKFTKTNDIEEKKKYAHIIAFTEELIETLEGDERTILFFKYIDVNYIRSNHELSKIIGKSIQEVAKLEKQALRKLSKQLEFLKLLSERI